VSHGSVSFEDVGKDATCSVSGTFTDAQKADALYWHNLARRDRAKDGKCSNMLELVWNDQAAAVSINYSEDCPSVEKKHNTNRHSEFTACSGNDSSECVMSTYCLGENMAWGGGNCDDGIVQSDSGVCTSGCDSDSYCGFKSMIYDEWVNNEGTALNCDSSSHCSQVVWQSSDQLGCGYKDCRSDFGMFVLTCNYLEAGNFNGDDNCEQGAACSSCPNTHPHCNDSLCSKTEPVTTETTATPDDASLGLSVLVSMILAAALLI